MKTQRSVTYETEEGEKLTVYLGSVLEVNGWGFVVRKITPKNNLEIKPFGKRRLEDEQARPSEGVEAGEPSTISSGEEAPDEVAEGRTEE